MRTFDMFSMMVDEDLLNKRIRRLENLWKRGSEEYDFKLRS